MMIKEQEIREKKEQIFILKAEIDKLNTERNRCRVESADYLARQKKTEPARKDITSALDVDAAAPQDLDGDGLPDSFQVWASTSGGVSERFFELTESSSTAKPKPCLDYVDDMILSKEAELARQEETYRHFRDSSEKELLEFESNKVEIILGRIYIALKELSAEAGLSEMVEKKAILCGHDAVDMTDELLAKLKKEGGFQ
jgi:hypothetical protein